jgi:hypothetical protein
MLLGLKPDLRVASLVQWQSSWLMLLGLKPGHTCDVISVVTEFMVDVAGVETRAYQSTCGPMCAAACLSFVPPPPPPPPPPPYRYRRISCRATAGSAIVSHGGSGTVHTALAAGVPQVLCPHMFDQFSWAERLSARGLVPCSFYAGVSSFSFVCLRYE